ncbi:MAG TPA: hypothetical protein EYN79_00480 [Planctomycetes bacterium]|nr:hypothetical protein [Planctomycetota bacterium]HIN79518.1 hypothetical protein [Planctomycetota bacterium]
MQKINAISGFLIKILSSQKLAAVLMTLLLLLTFLGTLEQVDHGLFAVQKAYFESWFLVHEIGPVPIPLPGGLLCMSLFGLNLLVGGLVRFRLKPSNLGIFIIHIGMAIMLASGLVKLYISDDGHLTLFEEEESNEFVSYHYWELAIFESGISGPVKEYLIPGEDFLHLGSGKSRVFVDSDLPFQVELSNFLANCKPRFEDSDLQAISPEIEGWALEELPMEVAAERNIAGLVATVIETAGETSSSGLLYGRSDIAPWSFQAGGRSWALALRHRRFSMPFTIRLDDFHKEDHPGIEMARSFRSDVTKFESGREQKIRIQMNEPLRDGGLVLFQSGWGPSNAPPGARLYTVLSVVRNPSDHWPLYSCIVIGAGMLIAFIQKLLKYAQRQARLREEGPE